MGVDLSRLTQLYLALWKLVDIQFPGHNWLELTTYSQPKLEARVSAIGVGPWAEDEGTVRDDIEGALKVARSEERTGAWLAEATLLRGLLLDRALGLAERLAAETRQQGGMSRQLLPPVVSALVEVIRRAAMIKQSLEPAPPAVPKDAQLAVSELLELTRGVASQCRLLSLNAAIEAARAGEHGRGFAVVAEEMRRLVSETEKAAEHVSAATDELARLALSRPLLPREDFLDRVATVSKHAEAARDSLTPLVIG